MSSAPLRFLLLVLALWVGVRAAVLAPGWPAGGWPIPSAAAAPFPVTAGAAPPDAPLQVAAAQRGAVARRGRPADHASWRAAPARSPGLASRPFILADYSLPLPTSSRFRVAITPVPPALAPPAPGSRPSASRWSGSAWLLLRDEEGDAALAPGGTLGGSQAGARATYALGGGVALSGRFYLPLRDTSGAELAAGLDWRPAAALPLGLLAERRQRLGRQGRNAVALTLYGGASRDLGPRLRLDLYGQAGIVGLRSRDLFADGALRLARRLGPVELGAAAWGAAQPGAARLDAGPSLAWRLPVRGANLRLQADWRFRLAGDAAPRSGPALTLATDF